MRHRKNAAHHRDRNRALWAGAVLVLIFAGSLYMATQHRQTERSLARCKSRRSEQHGFKTGFRIGRGRSKRRRLSRDRLDPVRAAPGKYLPETADRQQDLAHARQRLCDLRRSRVVEREYGGAALHRDVNGSTRSAAGSSRNSAPRSRSPIFPAKSSKSLPAISTGTAGAFSPSPGAIFIRPCDMAGLQAARRSRRQIAGMRRHHHALRRCKIESLAGGEIDARLRLEIARDLRAENRIPGEPVAAGKIDHQRNIAVRHRSDQKFCAQACQSWRRIRPRVEAMPGQIEIGENIVGHARDPETRKHAVEIMAMQDVELAKGHPTGPDLFHRRLIFSAPGIRESMPIARMAERPEQRGRFARDAGAPVDQRAEDIKE